MVETGELAPDFTVPMTGETRHDINEFSLDSATEEGPVVLVFYPASFTGGCTDEMCTFRDSMAEFNELETRVYGISVDLPFSQSAWIEAENLNFPMLSDWNHDVIHAYDVVRDDVGGSIETARRSIFIIDRDGVVRYKWVQTEGLPDFETVVSDVQDAVKTIR